MKSHRIALVVTTIGTGEFLAAYDAMVRRESLLDDVVVIVIPDRKTPAALYERCQERAAAGLHVRCPTIAEQDSYLARLGLTEFVPYDSDNRRNLGFLMAIEEGSECVVSIDDDNYCRNGERFFSEHLVVCGGDGELETIHSDNGWFNICELMNIDPPEVYPRGFPQRYRHRARALARTRQTGRVALNAGLWLNEPDVDAMTWLVCPPQAKSFKNESIALSRNTWSPINTQNTAVRREAMVAYYYLRMGHEVGNGIVIDRYGDILSGYFVQACVRHMGDVVRVGTPLVDHRRNSHNYMRDAVFEIGGMFLVDDMADWLRSLRLSGSTYAECYRSLADALDEFAASAKGFIWTDATRRCLHEMAASMRRWTDVCQCWL